MSAVAIFARLKEARVSVRVEGDKLKLKGKITPELLNDVAQVKPEIIRLLTASPWPAWRAQIANMPALPVMDDVTSLADYRLERLRRAALAFMNDVWSVAAVEAGWNATQLFGINPDAPASRVGAYGLVTFLAWSLHRPEIAGIDATHATLRTASGAEMRKPREMTDTFSVPFWQVEDGRHYAR